MATNHSKLFACPADTFFYSVSEVAGEDQVSLVHQGQHEQQTANYSSYIFNGANVRTNSSGQHPFPGMAGRKLDSIKAQIRTILVTEWPAIFPYSWHQPKQPISDVGNCAFNDAMDMAGFVDGHVNYIKIHLRQPKADTISIQYDPPADYDYQWSGD